MDRWDVNAIVLALETRFFSAATLAGTSLEASGNAGLSWIGNLSWAASSFVAEDRDEEAAMAMGGAVLGTLGSTGGRRRGTVAAQLAALEAAYRDRHDELVRRAWESLSAADLLDGAPSAINEHVWGILFPRVAYRQSLGELIRELREHLGRS